MAERSGMGHNLILLSSLLYVMSFAHLYSALRPSKTWPRNLLLARSLASNSLIFPNFMAVDVMCYNTSNRPCLRFICKSTIPYHAFHRCFFEERGSLVAAVYLTNYSSSSSSSS
mmetsp:Transcript_2838/g.3184  ORF Transcript_2838/g.3184 Transcript_2838/m.3184 type:complete len:114 (-) Transcript_2838:242-583(-)